MKVQLIAFTTFLASEVRDLMSWEPSHVDDGPDADMLAEFAGRTCYWSFRRPNPDTTRNVDYLRNVLSRGHHSVLEHASATFLLTGVSRTLTHELVRHRHLSFSQLSQRYVDESDAMTIVPNVLDSDDEGRRLARNMMGLQDVAHQLYGRIFEYARLRGASRKEARGAARGALLAGTRTVVVVTGNMRAWLDFIARRWHVAADPEIRELAGELRRQLVLLAPGTFQDVPVEPYGGGT